MFTDITCQHETKGEEEEEAKEEHAKENLTKG
jgi:hypothetical protein